MQNRNNQFENMMGEGVNWKAYIPKLLSNWWLFLLCLASCLGFAWFYLQYQAIPQYQVSAQVLIEDDQKAGNGGQGLNLVLGGANNTDNEMVVLRSKTLLKHLVRDYRFNETWFRKDQFKGTELFEAPFYLKVAAPVDSIRGNQFGLQARDQQTFLLTYEADGQKSQKVHRFGTAFQLPGIGKLQVDLPASGKVTLGTFDVMVSGLMEAVNGLKGSLSVTSAEKQASVIDLALTTAVPAKGEFILSKFIQEYINQNVRDKGRIADSTIAFIDERLIKVNVDLDDIEKTIQDFLQERGLSNLEAQSQIVLQNDNTYDQELVALEAEQELLGALMESIQNGKGGHLVAGGLLGDDGILNGLIANYNELTLQRETLLLDYQENNPFVRNVDGQLDTVKKNVLDYLVAKKGTLKLKLANAQQGSDRVKGRIHEVPEQERAFLALTRQQQLKQELYLFLLQKREETAVSKTNNIAGIRIVDDPAAGGAFAPKTQQIWTIAFLFGLLIPVGKVVVTDMFNTRIRDRKDLEKWTTLPVIGELSHHTGESDRLVFNASRTVLAEQFRGLRTNIQFLMAGEEDKVVMVTSGMPGEGKSFASLNLAGVLAASGKKVLLMEFDLRRPMLRNTYPNTTGKGISNYIVAKETILADIAVPVDDEGLLFFAACGPIPPNPSELIMHARTKQLMVEARKEFDIIIVDAPPLGAVTDAQLLSKYCDIVLNMVRAGRTPHDLIRLPADMVEAGTLRRVYMVLNDVKLNRGGHYGKSYYGYSYGYYDEDPPSLLSRLHFKR